ncbi:MAG: arginine--tRNA ligase [Candidatus Thiodiazotropha sp. 6PLUC9]
MKKQIEQLVVSALQHLVAEGIIPSDNLAIPKIERTKDSKHGDFATNAALVLSKLARKNPRELALAIVDSLPTSDIVEKCDIAGPGFINFTLSPSAYNSLIPSVIKQGHHYGRSELGAGKKVQVEYVSANPTGPLHVGHGRGAAYGSVVADLLEAIGYEVHREYYVNDAGRQMDILAASVWMRYLELCDETLTFPVNGYKGDYVWDIAATLHRDHGETYKIDVATLFEGVPADEPDGGDKELHIDALINQAKRVLGDNRYRFVFELGLNTILDDIRDDLSQFGVNYEEWYSERSLMESGAVNQVIERLRNSDHLYEKEGALWFRSTDFGDEKDRVVVRDNGQTTYFASDIAYHLDKLQRGFERVIDVWGADHHGYVPRVKAALKALGEDAEKLDVLLVQFAILYRGGEKAQMSTRSGEFVTLRELRKEVGADAARFFYVMRKCEQHMDFDLDLAKSQSNDNPVYYVQYAHARICSVLQMAAEQQITIASDPGTVDYACLTESQEQALLTNLAKYPEAVEISALNEEPHQLTHYLRQLATDFHTYYNAHKFLIDDISIRDARLQLIIATRQVLRNGLSLLGVSAPEKM